VKRNAYRAASQFVVFTIVVLVVEGLAVASHGHDVREHGAGAVVLVGIEEDTKTFKLVNGSEDWSLLCALLGEPECETIAIKGVLSVYLKLELDLPAGVSALVLVEISCGMYVPPNWLR
jgi:hypothetical protein